MPAKQKTMANYKMVKLSPREYKRLQKFGVAGTSMNDAMCRVLDLAEKSVKQNGKE